MEKAVPHVRPCNRTVFLKELIERKQPDAAVTLFKVMEEEGPALKENDRLQFCDFLIANGRIKEAKKVWRPWKKNDASLIHDGEIRGRTSEHGLWLEGQTRSATYPLNAQASRPVRDPVCTFISRDLATSIGTWRPRLSRLSPKPPYRLRFTRKSSGLSTDRGVFLAVSGFSDEKLNAASKQVTGESPWKEEKMEFAAPAGCEAVILRVRRNESLRMDNRISGDYWLGPVELTEK